ncbi:MAG: 30S ribosomal protein S11, partial [Planctomycetota bacterium]
MNTPTPAAASTKKKVRKNVTRGVVHVNATFNNTLVTITDTSGETISWDSAGTVGFKGARKSTPFAASRASEKSGGKAKRVGLRGFEVRVKGPDPGRESAITA